MRLGHPYEICLNAVATRTLVENAQAFHQCWSLRSTPSLFVAGRQESVCRQASPAPVRMTGTAGTCTAEHPHRSTVGRLLGNLLWPMHPRRRHVDMHLCA